MEAVDHPRFASSCPHRLDPSRSVRGAKPSICHLTPWIDHISTRSPVFVSTNATVRVNKRVRAPMVRTSDHWMNRVDRGFRIARPSGVKVTPARAHRHAWTDMSTSVAATTNAVALRGQISKDGWSKPGEQDSEAVVHPSEEPPHANRLIHPHALTPAPTASFT